MNPVSVQAIQGLLSDCIKVPVHLVVWNHVEEFKWLLCEMFRVLVCPTEEQFGSYIPMEGVHKYIEEVKLENQYQPTKTLIYTEDVEKGSVA